LIFMRCWMAKEFNFIHFLMEFAFESYFLADVFSKLCMKREQTRIISSHELLIVALKQFYSENCVPSPSSRSMAC
jgi:hypothetical protein